MSTAVKNGVGLLIGFSLGFICHIFDLPLPGPPFFLGAFIIISITVGFILTDKYLAKKELTQKGDQL